MTIEREWDDMEEVQARFEGAGVFPGWAPRFDCFGLGWFGTVHRDQQGFELDPDGYRKVSEI